MRKLRRDKLWDAILESEIFEEPALFFTSRNWIVSYLDPKANAFTANRSTIAIGRNIKLALRWIDRNQGKTYPQPETE